MVLVVGRMWRSVEMQVVMWSWMVWQAVLVVGRMGVHVMVRNLKVLVGMMVMMVVGNMVCMQRCMVVKAKNIRWFPNQSSWLAMIWSSLLLGLVRKYIF